MGRPLGSQNRDKPFRDALRAEIAAAQDENDFKSLRRIARELLSKAADGDVQAIKEIADRMDGKVPQAHIGGDEDDPPLVHEVRRIIVRPGHQDSGSVRTPAEPSEV